LGVCPFSQDTVSGRTNQENIDYATNCTACDCSEIVIFIAIVIIEKLTIFLAIDQHGVFSASFGHMQTPSS
jgi:hypothetical protein